MTMLDALGAITAGLLLGLLFFAGLWWTVQRLARFRWPALVVLGSLLLRTAAVLAGFHAAGGTDLRRLLLCLLGFVMARWLVARATRVAVPVATEEASRAP